MTDAAMPYAIGDAITVTDGPFAHLGGFVRRVDAAHGDLVVEVTMLGRPVPINVWPGQVART